MNDVSAFSLKIIIIYQPLFLYQLLNNFILLTFKINLKKNRFALKKIKKMLNNRYYYLNYYYIIIVILIKYFNYIFILQSF
jgi:hypothetical protein